MRHSEIIFHLLLSIFCFQSGIANDHALSSIYLGSRESDPASLVENVSTVHGDYTEVEVDLIVPAPDPLILSRFYSSRDTLKIATLGGWRFNSHCFLSIHKDQKAKSYTTEEGKFEYVHIYAGTQEGCILTYVGWLNTMGSKRALFKIDVEEEIFGFANTARGTINAWTNLKNNELYFDPQKNFFELFLSSGGKRFYIKHPSLDIYLLHYEILPSGNKVFYEFDERGQLVLIKETNASEKKILAWISLQYENGIHIETSDGKSVDYHFHKDATDYTLLTDVLRSDKPNLHYQYETVDDQTLLLKKELPECRYVEIRYYMDKENKYKVRSVTTPAGLSGTVTTQFSYGENSDGNRVTEVYGPSRPTTFYHFNEDFQLTRIEQYLNGSLYRVHKKSWGKKTDMANLASTSIEDGCGSIFHYKTFTYDDRGNVLREEEWGNLTGADPNPLVIDENGRPRQEANVKTYSYFSGKSTDGFFQKDAKGTGIKFWYKKGTNLLLKKFLLNKGSPNREEEDESSEIKKRYFYEYNEDAALVRVIVDDGGYAEAKQAYNVNERHVISISPKQELPHVGAPEIIEEKYLDSNGKTEILLKKAINQFDLQGNVVAQSVFDANGKYRYSITKAYQYGLLILETDPMGNETRYFYDGNQNLVEVRNTSFNASIEYQYDLKNRPICIVEKDGKGNCFETQLSYDLAGNKVFEIDRFGNQITYVNDDFGRLISISYPEWSGNEHFGIRPTFTYVYDIFDNPTSITDSGGKEMSTLANVHGKPVAIHHSDGTRELFKYDCEGSLHRYSGRDGLIQVFEYDYIGRLNHIEYYKRESKGSEDGFKRKYYSYNAFHLLSECDEKGDKTTYSYDQAGRLLTVGKGNQKIEFIYDALGRTQGIKKWKSSKSFTLQVKEYDLLNRVIEERIEDSKNQILAKNGYSYNNRGQLTQVIGYPQNQESVLMHCEYDGFGRLSGVKNACGDVTQILYDDAFINQWGQRVQKRTRIDPLGNQTEEIFDPSGNLSKTLKKDKEGNVLAETDALYGISSNEIPKFEYNSYGDLIAEYKSRSKDPIIYQYNAYGNVHAISYKEGSKENTHQLFYDESKNIIKIKLASFQILTYSYDENDFPLTETIQDEFGAYQVSRSYDGEGKIQALILPDGSFIEYTYEGPFVKSAIRFSKEKKELYNYRVASRDLMGNSLEEILVGHVGARKQCWDRSGRKIRINTDFFQDNIPEGGFDPLANIKKRESILDDEKYTIVYDYNPLSQLVSEKGEIEHIYLYDSQGNRLKKDEVIYTVNDANQLLETAGARYTFDLTGNLATKTIAGKTWIYEWNPLNQLVLIKDPDQMTIAFTYDLSGRRLTKRIESKGKKAKIFRYFYLGETELGCLDEKGAIIELKIPSDPNNPEVSPCVAIEIIKDTYVPLYDLQGNIVCLVDHQRRKIVERYRYSAFGEEEIKNGKGKLVSDSAAGNPWRYQGKRIDKETGLIYFGKRYYDPEVGRWISPDPAGNLDGPNLYIFARNNPLIYVDYFGLSAEINGTQSKEFLNYFYGEYEPHCYCEVHRDCKRGGDIRNAMVSLVMTLATEGPSGLRGGDIRNAIFSMYLAQATAGLASLVQTHSTPYEIGSIDSASIGIGFINGIRNTRTEAQEHALQLHRYAQGFKIQGVYNATHTAAVDALECVVGQCGMRTPPVELLKSQWNRFISNHGPDAKFLQIAHSGGSVHVFNALFSSTKAVQNRIIVLAISPAAVIPNKLCYKAYNYTSKRDFIPSLDVMGKWHYGDQLILLEPHPDASFHDHGFDSPTFQQLIKDNIANYLIQYGGVQ